MLRISSNLISVALCLSQKMNLSLFFCHRKPSICPGIRTTALSGNFYREYRLKILSSLNAQNCIDFYSKLGLSLKVGVHYDTSKYH